MEGSSKLFCSLKSAWARERISSKFVDNLDARPQTMFASRDIYLRFRNNETRKTTQTVAHVTRHTCKPLSQLPSPSRL